MSSISNKLSFDILCTEGFFFSCRPKQRKKFIMLIIKVQDQWSYWPSMQPTILSTNIWIKSGATGSRFCSLICSLAIASDYIIRHCSLQTQNAAEVFSRKMSEVRQTWSSAAHTHTPLQYRSHSQISTQVPLPLSYFSQLLLPSLWIVLQFLWSF